MLSVWLVAALRDGARLGVRADWVHYHADLGVAGMHLYAAMADFILSPRGGGYPHVPGSYRPLAIENHRLLHWKLFHPSPWSLHYYGQWLMHNDCAFRWRHAYAYIAFLDLDQFLHFPGQRPHQERALAVPLCMRRKMFVGTACRSASVHALRDARGGSACWRDQAAC
jgi:hypothetical protein